MHQPLRVLQVVPNMQQGGIENYIMNMYRNIDRTQVQFDFLEHYSDDHYFDQEIRDLGGQIYRIPLMENKKNIIGYKHELKKLFTSHPYQIVHGHMGTTAMFYLSAARKCMVPNRFIHAHEDSYIRNLRGYVRKALIQNSWRNATRLLACSETSGHYYFGDRPFTTLHNAINTQRFTYSEEDRKAIRAQYHLSSNTLVLCHVGRFSKQKNHHFLIETFNALAAQRANSALFLIGVGETLEETKRQVKEYGLENKVFFVGATGQPEKYYSASDLFLLPSFFEGLPLTGIEAQCSGLPCLMTDTVTQEVNVTGQVHFMSLDNSPTQWAHEIINMTSPTKLESREQAPNYIKNAGYDAFTNSQRMQQFYLEASSDR